MATQQQIDSARRNGALSRGPVTAEGRTKSSQNSLKHGMTAKKIFVLANESSEAFNKVVEGFLDHYQPANDLERELCLNIAYAHWRLRRLAIIETALFDKTMVEGEGVDEGLRLASAFESLVGDGALTQLTQYEARLHRTIHRLSERLEKIQKAAAAATEPPHGTATGRERTQNTPPPAATSIRERATITPINSKNEPDLSATPDPDEQSLPPFVSPYN